MHRKVLDTGNFSKRLKLDADSEENVEAVFTVLAMTTKINKDNPQYQFLIEQSTTNVPLHTYRKEYLSTLKLLYNECFLMNGRFFLPIVDTDILENIAKAQIMDKCYELLAESICKRLFNGVEQLTCGELTVDVPTVKSKVHII